MPDTTKTLAEAACFTGPATPGTPFSPNALREIDTYPHTERGAAAYILHALAFWRESKARSVVPFDRGYAFGQVTALENVFRVLTGWLPEDVVREAVEMHKKATRSREEEESAALPDSVPTREQ